MLNQEQLKKFEDDGYLIIENFVSLEDCSEMKDECDRIIETYHFSEEYKNLPKFGSQAGDEYFLTSTDKIRAFLESDASKAIENGDNPDKPKLIFNKIGHALHVLNPVFKKHTFSENVKSLFKSIGYVKPIVCQSMYIFKQPYIGDKVVPHQDGSYLHTDPLKVIGLWIALEDCTIENGCLSFAPGSHKDELKTRFIRNPNKNEFNEGKYLIYTNPNPNFSDYNFVPCPIKAGSAILIDGLVVHQSEANRSSKSRHIYTFHVYDSHETVFSEDNWMEPSPISFRELYNN